MKRVKRPITLIELMVVLAIIGSIAGVVGLSIKKALREQRFKNEVEEFVSALRLAQNLMVIADADIHVKVTAGADGITYTLESERQLPAGWDKELAHASKTLKSIHHLSFNESSGGAADFKFFSGGAVMSQGCIALSTDDGPNSLIRYIPLPGYPAPIRSGENVEEILEDNSPINSATILEVQSLQQTGSTNAKEE